MFLLQLFVLKLTLAVGSIIKNFCYKFQICIKKNTNILS